MCASYNPPSEFITEFNTSLFNQPEDTLSQAEANKLYLSKTLNDISTAPSTTFNGNVSIGGLLNLTSGSNTSELSQSGTLLTIANRVPSGSIGFSAQTSGGTNQGMTLTSAALTMNNFITLNTRIIRSTDTTSVTHSLFDNITTGTLVMGGTAGINSIRGVTTFTQDAIFANRLNFSATSYSFPFASSQSLGYYLTNTGTGTSVTTATQTSILTTSTIPIGVWSVNFSVKNTTGASGGTITAAHSYIATSAAPTTALSFTGALVRSHVSETYATGDIQIITSSFTLNVSTAQTYSLTIFRTFAAGTFTFIGEASFTRLA